MPASEIVWRAKVWEHTGRLVERSFLHRPFCLAGQSSPLLSLLKLREGGCLLCQSPALYTGPVT